MGWMSRAKSTVAAAGAVFWACTVVHATVDAARAVSAHAGRWWVSIARTSCLEEIQHDDPDVSKHTMNTSRCFPTGPEGTTITRDGGNDDDNGREERTRASRQDSGLGRRARRIRQSDSWDPGRVERQAASQTAVLGLAAARASAHHTARHPGFLPRLPLPGAQVAGRLLAGVGSAPLGQELGGIDPAVP